jgi:hypothetical protein
LAATVPEVMLAPLRAPLIDVAFTVPTSIVPAVKAAGEKL